MAERAMTASLSSRPSHMCLSSSYHHANPNHCEMDEQLMTWIEQLWRHDATIMSCYSLGRQAGIVSVYLVLVVGSQRGVSSHSQSTPPSVELPS
eukprot:scaffold1409_cov149-Alexandrium_tamarense.AAC.1